MMNKGIDHIFIVVLNVFLSFIGLVIFTPVLIVFCVLIWLEDFHSPFYISSRVGKDGKLFKMLKLRSMIVDADKQKIDNTSVDDVRVIKIGRIIRKYKIDEFPQLINVLKGDINLIGPRPDVARSVALYTDIEKKLLTVKPGMADIASIVFCDAEKILENSPNPDLDYNQLIRPWKSRLGLIYIENRSVLVDVCLIFLTVTALFSQQLALKCISKLLEKWQAANNLKQMALRQEALKPFPPPGATEIVNSYQ